MQSYKNASRLPRDTPDLSLVGIPSLPLSYHDALPLLRTLSGKGEKIDEWQGGLTEHGVEYFTGPSDESLVLNNQIEEKINPARLPPTAYLVRYLTRTNSALERVCINSRPHSGRSCYYRQSQRRLYVVFDAFGDLCLI